MMSLPELTKLILTKTITEFLSVSKLLPEPPSELHHFTTMEAACHIISSDDVRLTHAEYSNDQTEMERAKYIIRCALRDREADPFFSTVSTEYQRFASDLDAYVLCMSTGKTGDAPQDILSQWRAYGQDGKGACLTLDRKDLDLLIHNTPGLRLNPAIYDSSNSAEVHR